MKSLTTQQYESLREACEVTALDGHGDKVLKLRDGTYLKLFRIKRLFTSARIFPYWQRFEKNAAKLDELGVPTLKVKEIFKLPDIDRTAVHYDPLPGRTLRELEQLNAELVGQLGRFIRELHDKGVYLRSMHLGNIVLTPDNQLGLIDIADMKIHGKSLSRGLRFRNFHHLCRYQDDRRLVAVHLPDFLAEFDESYRVKLNKMFQG
jgi:tRNA A-37 threonylcarbamoyl transferase component Bud32